MSLKAFLPLAAFVNRDKREDEVLKVTPTRKRRKDLRAWKKKRRRLAREGRRNNRRKK